MIYRLRCKGLVGSFATYKNDTAHGLDADTWERASSAELKPHKIEDTMAFMFESRHAMRLMRYAIELPEARSYHLLGSVEACGSAGVSGPRAAVVLNA
jgi:homogentisate 1,2-dioxygenase